jgi:hypothetical protein
VWHDSILVSKVRSLQPTQGDSDLGVAQRDAGDVTDAIGALTESVGLRRGLCDSEPSNPIHQRELAIGLRHIGVAHRLAGEETSAIGALTESVEIYRRLCDGESTNPLYKGDLATAEQLLAQSN